MKPSSSPPEGRVLDEVRFAAPGGEALDLSLMPFEYLPDSSRRELTSFLDSAAMTHALQQPAWVDALRAGYGYRFIHAEVRAAGQLRCAGAAGISAFAGSRFLRTFTFMYGPVCDDSGLLLAALPAIRSALSRLGGARLDIHPHWPRGESHGISEALFSQGWKEFSSAGLPASLRADIAAEPAELMRRLRKTTRHEVARAAGRGLKLVDAIEPSELRDFGAVYGIGAREKGFKDEPQAFWEAIGGAFRAEPGRGALLMACVEGRPLGGVAVVRSGRTCWYLLGASLRPPDFSVGHWLLFQSMLWAREHGCDTFDFSGGHGGAQATVSRFKRGFSGTQVEFLTGFRVILSPWRHRLLGLVDAARRAGRLLHGSGSCRR